MRIFITGGTGFIGWPVVQLLKKSGHEILVLSRERRREKGVRFVLGDLADLPRFQAAVKRFRPEAALHAAWGGIPNYDYKTNVINLKQSLDLFDLLYGLGCKKIVFTGSCLEYGSLSGKLREDQLGMPKNAFAAAKLAISRLCEEAARERGAAFISARLFFVYGPGQRAASLIPSIVEALRAGAKPEIKNPSGANDMIYVGDAAVALAEFLTKSAPSGIYNVGAGKLTPVAEVLNILYREFGRSERFAPSSRQSFAAAFYADLGKIKKTIGWKPVTDLETGIKRVLALSSLKVGKS